MFKLFIADDEGKTTVVPLVREEITIGRKEGNTVRLTERNVSRHHAVLRKKNGAFVLEDLKSYNGIKVNGERIDGEVELESGDSVGIGDYVLSLEAAEEPAARSESPPEPVSPEDQPQVVPARLVMLSAPAPGAEFAVSEGVQRIGRAEDLDIWVNHRSISREHAEIESTSERIRIADLQSANGLRINGQEIDDGELQSGDLVELGQVRFRFVAAGEPYVFDSDEAAHTEGELRSKRRRWPLIAVAAVIALAIAVGGGIAITTERRATIATPIADDLPEVPEPAEARPPETVEPEPAAEWVDACEKALAEQDWPAAGTHARQALSVDPENERAQRCRDRAQAAHSAQEAFERGQTALALGDTDGAYFAFEELPEQSALRERPEVAKAQRLFAENHLELAQEALRDDPEEAARHANTVLTMPDLQAKDRKRARQLLAKAQRRSGRSTAVASARKRPARPSRSSAPAQESPPPTAPSPSAPESSPEPAPGGLDVARACLRSGDNSCVVRALEGGRARSSGALALLIETYRTLGNTSAAVRHMKTFVRRYPGDRRASRYQQFLINQGSN